MGKRSVSGENNIQLEASWLNLLKEEFDADYMRSLKTFLQREKAAGKEIYPPGNLIFNALDSTPVDKVKIVILGQDPYHGPGRPMVCASLSVPVLLSPHLFKISTRNWRLIWGYLQRVMGICKPGQIKACYYSMRCSLLKNPKLPRIRERGGRVLLAESFPC